MSRPSIMEDVTVSRVVVGVALALIACNPDALQLESSPRLTPTQSSGPAPAAVAVGDWSPLAPAPAGWSRPEGAFWIKDRLVVVAGSTAQTWERETNQWRVIAEIPQADECEGCGYSEVVVWTGKKLLMWGGGFSYRSPDGTAHTGVAVDLHGRIEPLPEAPIPVRWWHQAVWTGEEMIIFGGGRDSHARKDGAAYDPSARTWRMLRKAPVGGYANSLIWTGKEMITWGGIRDSKGAQGFPSGFVSKGAAYNPKSDTWRLLPPSNLDPRGWHTAVWTGEEMLVWGGVAEPRSDCYDCGYGDDAAAYEPKTDSWRTIPAGPLSGRVEHTAVWTGDSMIVYGGSAPGGGPGKEDGAVYDSRAGTWSVLPDPPIKGRYRHAVVWNGREMIVWGGQNPNGQGFSDGAFYRPGQ